MKFVQPSRLLSPCTGMAGADEILLRSTVVRRYSDSISNLDGTGTKLLIVVCSMQ
jgi:hypothetical protein